MSDLVGEVLLDYRVDALIGAGPAGEVYRGVHLAFGVPVALKVIAPRFTAAPDFKARFLRHGQLLAPLVHAHIARVHHCSQDARTFIVSEYVPGRSLEALRPPATAAEWQPAWWRAVELLRQAAEALMAAHDRRIDHGDLTLRNLLLTGDDPQTASVKVTDFGLRRLFAAPGGDLEFDPQPDVRALGRLLYELTTGRALPPGSESSAPAPSGFVPSYPSAVESVVQCLLGAGADRAGTAGEAAALLRAAAGLAGTTTTLPAVREPQVMDVVRATPVALMAAKPPIPPNPAPTPQPTLHLFDERHDLIRVIPVKSARYTIGTAADNDIVVAADRVAPHHARIEFDGTRVLVTDLGGTTGTWLVARRPGMPDYDREALLPQFACGWRTEIWLQVGSCWLWLEPAAKAEPARLIELSLDQASRSLSFVPGGSQICRLTLLNQGTQVDRVTLSIDGMNPDWVEGINREIKVPANGRKEAALTISVPRSPDATAGEYRVTIAVHSQANPDVEHGSVEALWTVQPFDHMATWLTPKKAGAWRRAKYTLTLHNQGNRTTKYQVSGADDEKQFEFELSGGGIGHVGRLPLQVPPKEKVPIKVQLMAPRRWFGSATSHAFTVEGEGEDNSPRVAAEGQFSHRALLPVWALLLIPVVFVGVAMFGTRYLRPVVRPPAVVPRMPLPNEQVVLTWDAPRATTIRVLQDGVAVEPQPDAASGRYMFPAGFEKDTQIQVIGYNLFGTSSATAMVTLRKTPPTKAKLPTVQFTIDPPGVIVGQTATLFWSVTDATHAELDQFGSVPLQGSRLVQPTAERSYTLTAYNADNATTTKTLTVTVSKGVFVPTDMKLAITSPAPRSDGKRLEVRVGNTVTLRWEARNATTLRIDSVPSLDLMSASGSRIAEIRGEGLYEFVLVATDELNREYRTDAIQIWGDCSAWRLLRMKIPCSKTPQVVWK